MTISQRSVVHAGLRAGTAQYVPIGRLSLTSLTALRSLVPVIWLNGAATPV
jgi:hypothetical protein